MPYFPKRASSAGSTGGSSGADQTVTFTPTTAGWYRIMTGSQHMGGIVRITSDQWDNAYDDVELSFDVAGYGLPSDIQQTRQSVYNIGHVDQVRVGNNGSAVVY